jgi:hypothetical protein
MSWTCGERSVSAYVGDGGPSVVLLGDVAGEMVGLVCQAHQIYWKGRGRRRVRTSRCMAEEERRGMGGRTEVASSDVLVAAVAIDDCVGTCDIDGLRDRESVSRVLERDREGIVLSRVGKLFVEEDILARVVMVGRI